MQHYHRLLQRQIKKYLGEEKLNLQECLPFLNAVNDSYFAYEKDKELSEHAFTISQNEYAEINNLLKTEVELRKTSIFKLKETLQTLTYQVPDNVKDDLLEIVYLLDKEVALRKEVEQKLQEAKELAEKANKAKSDFLSIISHEIRTPLNAVIGMGHLLLKDDPREDQLFNLMALKSSADNLLTLINDILDFNKIEAGKLELEDHEFNFLKLIKDVINANSYAANEKQNVLNLQVQPNFPALYSGASIRVTQVLNNIISNAIKFTSYGTIKIELSYVPQNNLVQVQVSDTGIGIDEKQLQLLFIPFSQANSTIARQFGGTGLGLAICKRILDIMGGSITVQSTPNVGSIFTVQFPLKTIQVSSLHLQLQTQQTKKSLSGKRILLVEDTLFNVMVATQLLESWDAIVDVADNGAIAIDKIRSTAFDIILMDLQMPIMDGFSASKKIRSFNTSIPIVALTASNSLDMKERVKQAGMQDFITKPFNPDEFYNQIVKELEG